jgi:diguanylate cyclase (GGDEF)-like protein
MATRVQTSVGIHHLPKTDSRFSRLVRRINFGVASSSFAAGVLAAFLLLMGAGGAFFYAAAFLAVAALIRLCAIAVFPGQRRRKGDSYVPDSELVDLFTSALIAVAYGALSFVAFTSHVSEGARVLVTINVVAFLALAPARHATRPRNILWLVAGVAPPFLAGAMLANDYYCQAVAVATVMIVFAISRSNVHLQHSLAAAAEAERRLDAASNNISHGMLMLDAHLRVLVCNGRFLSLFGIRNAVSVGSPFAEFVKVRVVPLLADKVDGNRLVDVCRVSVPGGARTETFKLKGGKVLELSVKSTHGGVVAFVEDVTNRQDSEAKYERMARYDAVTGLPNRFHFRDSLQKAFEALDAGGVGFTLVCIDLDRFKQVNDTLGHPVGDRLLQQVAERMTEMSRAEDLVARIGGDEFVVVCNADRDAASKYAERIVETMSRPFSIDGNKALIGASIGMAVGGADGEDADMLMRAADLALYAAKGAGRGTWRFFDKSLATVADKKRIMEIDIRNALQREEFEVHFQPIIDLTDGRISCCEALVRWRHPQRGMVSPVEFVPMAEETGQIIGIGDYVLTRSCLVARGWPAKVRVAVNFSARQFSHGNPVESIRAALKRTGLDPQRLEIEITESLLINDVDRILGTLQEIRDMGVRIALDDFGTGFSSLSYLNKIRPHKVKIDRSFVLGIRDEACSTLPIIRAVAAMAADLDMEVVVEGVETAEEMSILFQNGAGLAQGYLFSKPRTEREINAMVANPFDLMRGKKIAEMARKHPYLRDSNRAPATMTVN